MKNEFETFKTILRGSKQYEFIGENLKLTNYYTGESVIINLGAIDEDMFDMIVTDEENAEDSW